MEVLWGELQVIVDGQNQKDLVVSLQSGMTFSGHVSLDGSGTGTQASPDLTRARVTMSAQGNTAAGGGGLGAFGGFGGGPGGANAASVDATGRFTVTGIVPGKYTIRVTGVTGWSAKSITAGGREALDFGFEVKGGDPASDISVMMTTKTTEIDGTLQDASGRPTADYTIIVYPTDTQYWIPQSRRIQSTRPGTDGKFTVRGLPPGDYMTAAVTDLDPGAQYDPAFLDQLKSASTPIHLSEGDKKPQDLKVAGGSVH
jgi:hypothetical protein